MDPVLVMPGSVRSLKQIASMPFCYRINEMKNGFCKANHSVVLLPHPPPKRQILNNKILCFKKLLSCVAFQRQCLSLLTNHELEM